MKIRLVVAAVMFVLLMCSAGWADQEVVNQNYGYSFNFPEGWQVASDELRNRIEDKLVSKSPKGITLSEAYVLMENGNMVGTFTIAVLESDVFKGNISRIIEPTIEEERELIKKAGEWDTANFIAKYDENEHALLLSYEVRGSYIEKRAYYFDQRMISFMAFVKNDPKYITMIPKGLQIIRDENCEN